MRAATNEAALDHAVALLAESEQRYSAGDARRAAASARQALALFQRHAGRHHPDVAAARSRSCAARGWAIRPTRRRSSTISAASTTRAAGTRAPRFRRDAQLR